MPAGSEQLTWKRYPGVPRACASCGRSLRIVDVARVHTAVDASGRATSRFYCRAHVHRGYGS